MSTPVKKSRSRRVFYVHLRCPNEKLLEELAFKDLVWSIRKSSRVEHARLFISRRFFRVWRTTSGEVARKMNEALTRRALEHRSVREWEVHIRQRFE